ncbi:hypothetical protein EVJ58_g10187 [Rhodofomes roseus]|uniref:WD40 repeat protein n=1 Tax=Rhodofomes roseus TaxID=34475 RepID=A0A4Y9XQS5_9APHY|nr:hypothetical protein EVJ58_g10187 [Rhodofomes roseus]
MLDDVDPQAVEHFSLAPVTKHYAVQDVQFNPAYPTRIASSANDLTVRIWDCDQVFNEDEESPEDEANPEDKQSPEPVHTEEYECTMGKLLFKPGEPVLAMGGHDGSVYVLRDEGRTPIASRLRLARGKTDETGDIAWGCGPLSDKLFASSMTKAEKAFSGTHKVFDMTTERPICTMEIQEAGDSIAVHPAGTFVAIATKPSKRAHTLYLFDGRRLGSQPVHTLALDSFQQSVTTMKFSPDGVYLALARDDNTTDVYDARFLGRGKLHAFTHEPGNVLTYTKDVYGVVEAQWVEGHPSGLGLVTGGCDGACVTLALVAGGMAEGPVGCVRLWDVRLADSDPNNGLPIAQCGHDLGHFSLGDPSRDEMPLVM